jgi:hypothetical protein
MLFVYYADDTLCVCDHHNYRIQKWYKGAATSVTVVNTTGDHPEALTFDKNGFLSRRKVQVGNPRYLSTYSAPVCIFGCWVSALTPLAITESTPNLKNPDDVALDSNLSRYINICEYE